MSKRFVVEAEWSGYRSSQRRPCHREVVNEKQAERFKKIIGFRFSDGTSMTLSVRPCLKRERVDEIRGYDRVMHNAVVHKLEGFLDILDPRL